MTNQENRHAVFLDTSDVRSNDGNRGGSSSRPGCHTGATVWNSGNDDISQDEFGVGTVRNQGRRVAEVALHRAPPSG
jgi:hypothetical protein